MCIMKYTIVGSNVILSSDGFYFLRRFGRLDVRRRRRRSNSKVFAPEPHHYYIGKRHNAHNVYRRFTEYDIIIIIERVYCALQHPSSAAVKQNTNTTGGEEKHIENICTRGLHLCDDIDVIPRASRRRTSRDRYIYS